ncbi:MAG: hypothetical protein ACOYZ7_15370 [Chloroflexota bacterium]
MSHISADTGEAGRASRLDGGGQGRFILLILLFNILLITTLILSLQQQQLIEEYEWIIETRTVIVEQVITQEAVEPVTVTVVVAPGFTPLATPTGP